MKATKNRYTKEQFVKEFLLRQAKSKTENLVSENKNNLKVVSSSLEKHIDNTTNIETAENKKVDLTDTKEVLNIKTSTNESEKSIPVNLVKNDSDNKQINTVKESVKQLEKEKEDVCNNGNITFEIKIVYETTDLCFNGLNLLEEKLKDGNLQVGFDVNVGVFVGDTIKKIVRKKRTKIETTEVCAQLSFE